MSDKILILGDIHGKTIWRDIISKENPDKIIFLGDYVSTHSKNITNEQQISNLKDILDYKKENSNKVVLLRGNHDMQFLGYHWAECSGYNRTVSKEMIKLKTRFLDSTKWLHIIDNIVFSHAGVSKVWLQNVCGKDISIEQSLIKINNTRPSEIFGFTPEDYFDMTGTSKTQPLTWIRPGTLEDCNIEGYDQVIGHTPVERIVSIVGHTGEKIWLCDCLDNNQYLIINNKQYIPSSL